MMGCNNSKSHNYKEKNYGQNQQATNPQKDEAKEIEEQKQNILSDSMQQRNRDIQNQNYQSYTNYPPLPSNSQSNNNNNIEMQSIPVIKCHLHPTEDIKGININQNIQQKMCCFNCIIEYKFQGEDLIDMKDIFDCAQKDKFQQKYPKYANQINKKLAMDSLNDTNPITKFFEEKIENIKKSIITQIETQFESIKQSLTSLQQQKNYVKQQLQSQKFQEEIKGILTQDKKNTNELEKQIEDLMNNQIKAQASFENKISQYYENIANEVNKSQKIMQSFQSDFNQFSYEYEFFSDNDQVQLQNCLSQYNINIPKYYPHEVIDQNNLNHYGWQLHGLPDQKELKYPLN